MTSPISTYKNEQHDSCQEVYEIYLKKSYTAHLPTYFFVNTILMGGNILKNKKNISFATTIDHF